MNVLIITGFADLHALVIKEAINRSGSTCEILTSSDFPGCASISWQHGMSTGSPIVDSSELGNAVNDCGVIWNRKPFLGNIFSSRLSADDKKFCQKETQLFFRSFLLSFHRHAFWVNPHAGKMVSEAKALQLTLAREIGLTIPETLISNDASAVRQFTKNFEEGAIFKSFHSRMWIEGRNELSDGKTFTNFTRKFDEGMFDDESIALSVGIYQNNIEKDFELRILVCGKSLLAAKILSQSSPSTEVDFRLGQAFLQLEEYALPAAVENMILELFLRLGIVFGSVDMVVDKRGNYIFLEVNEQGQFLWMELNNPELLVTQMVTKFLMSADAEFKWSREPNFIRLADITDKEFESNYLAMLNDSRFLSMTAGN